MADIMEYNGLGLLHSRVVVVVVVEVLLLQFVLQVLFMMFPVTD